jgi:hypothetical protein
MMAQIPGFFLIATLITLCGPSVSFAYEPKGVSVAAEADPPEWRGSAIAACAADNEQNKAWLKVIARKDALREVAAPELRAYRATKFLCLFRQLAGHFDGRKSVQELARNREFVDTVNVWFSWGQDLQRPSVACWNQTDPNRATTCDSNFFELRSRDQNTGWALERLGQVIALALKTRDTRPFVDWDMEFLNSALPVEAGQATENPEASASEGFRD